MDKSNEGELLSLYGWGLRRAASSKIIVTHTDGSGAVLSRDSKDSSIAETLFYRMMDDFLQNNSLGGFMKDTDAHFWVSDVAKILPAELLPKVPSWSALLDSITQLKTERDNAIAEAERLKDVIKETIEENLHLADGENCTLIKLKRVISCEVR